MKKTRHLFAALLILAPFFANADLIEVSIEQTLANVSIGTTYDMSFAMKSQQGCCTEPRVSLLDTEGYDLDLDQVIETQTIPEPGTLALFGLGLLGVGLAWHRMKV